MRGRDTNFRRWNGKRGRGKDDTVGNKKNLLSPLKVENWQFKTPFSFIRLLACLSVRQFLKRISDIHHPLYYYPKYGVIVQYF